MARRTHPCVVVAAACRTTRICPLTSRCGRPPPDPAFGRRDPAARVGSGCTPPREERWKVAPYRMESRDGSYAAVPPVVQRPAAPPPLPSLHRVLKATLPPLEPPLRAPTTPQRQRARANGATLHVPPTPRHGRRG